LPIFINSYNESYVYYIGVFYWLKKEINSSDLRKTCTAIFCG